MYIFIFFPKLLLTSFTLKYIESSYIEHINIYSEILLLKLLRAPSLFFSPISSLLSFVISNFLPGTGDSFYLNQSDFKVQSGFC